MRTNLDLREQTMTSLEIAELTGKPHNDVLKAIRKMEPAWTQVTQGKFSLSSYQDATGRTLPCYQLTKTECLYIATKFTTRRGHGWCCAGRSWKGEDSPPSPLRPERGERN